MDQANFLEQLEEIFEMDAGSVSADSVLQDLDGFDSVGALSLIALIDECFDISLEGSEIIRCPTVGDLLETVHKRAA